MFIYFITIFFAVTFIFLIWFSCFTKSGKDLSWSLLKFNPWINDIFPERESYDRFQSIFGVFLFFLVGSFLLLIIFEGSKFIS